MEEKSGVKKTIKKIMHVLNPLAGKGAAAKIKDGLKGSDYVYMSKTPDDATEFIKKTCREDPDTCFTVYGGDGTVFKAVNALMESGYADRAALKIVPVGSGNDFVRSFEGKSGEFAVDVMRFNGRYAVNVINMGFDCAVVQRAQGIKKLPFMPGKAAYAFGVVGELLNRKKLTAKITYTDKDGNTLTEQGDYLLIAIGNGAWYGGGFKVTPLAKTDDGLVDLMFIRNVKTSTFINFVGDFKKGTLVDENGEPREDLKPYLVYKKCTSVKVEGCPCVCADGEIFNETTVDVSVIPKGITYIKD